jgi:nitrogen regulatory protein PII
MDLVRMQLVTIIAPTALKGHIEKDLQTLGVPGYTVTKASGRGHSGPRDRGVFDEGVVQFEILASAETARAILGRIGEEAETFGLLAFSAPVEAVPRPHFK